jgi:hypothetical protein
MYGKYSLFNMVKVARANETRIKAQLAGSSIEGFTPDQNAGKYLGLDLALFLGILLLNFALWIWALVWTVKYWSVLPDWAKVLAVIGLFTPMGPVMTLIVVYIGKGQKKSVGLSRSR